MLVVELHEAIRGQLGYEKVATITLDDDGRVLLDDPKGYAAKTMEIPMVWRWPDGHRGRLYFRDDPATWLRNLDRILRSGYTVPVVVRDDGSEMTREEVAARLGVYTIRRK